MFTHALSWSEITTLFSALGLVLTAAASFYITLKKSAFHDDARALQPIRAPSRRNSATHAGSRFYP